MQFISWQFILFFILAMLMLLPKWRNKKYFLLVLNITFCLYSGLNGLITILLFGFITYFGARNVERNRKRQIFVIWLIISLLPLLFYKYTDFVVRDILNISTGILSSVAVPLGISFFTFQGVGYLIDVYKGKCGAEKNFIDYFIYLSLFTCVTSGPINRSKYIISQIKRYETVEFDYNRCTEGFRYVLLGILLKLLISGRMAPVVSTSFSAPDTSSGLTLLIASICFTIQIFSDFCSYSYMAFGLSKVIGIDVIQNFEKPYFSKSITEFWRRWHISLSSWLRDYVYIPLGGSRCSKFRNYLNLLITFTVSGLWHGAAWTYIFWGLLNGVILVAEKITGLNREVKNKFVGFVRWIITIILVNTMWIFFRAEKLADAFIIIRKICLETIADIFSLTSFNTINEIISSLGITAVEMVSIIVGGISFILFELFVDSRDKAVDVFNNKSTVLRWIQYAVIIFAVLIFGATGQVGEFIYAKF